MRLRIRTVIVAVVILGLFSALPILGQSSIPEEAYMALSTMGGIDLRAVLNKVAVFGLVIAFIVVLGDVFEKYTVAWLAASSVTRVIWVMVIALIPSFGDLQHLGFTTIGSGSGASFNMVEIDLRFFVVMVAIIFALKIGYSVLEYRKNIVKISAS